MKIEESRGDEFAEKVEELALTFTNNTIIDDPLHPPTQGAKAWYDEKIKCPASSQDAFLFLLKTRIHSDSLDKKP